MTRTFHVGSHIWFVVHYNPAGEITGVEEHDFYAGGHLGHPDSGKTWTETFVHHALRRGATGVDIHAFLEGTTP